MNRPTTNNNYGYKYIIICFIFHIRPNVFFQASIDFYLHVSLGSKPVGVDCVAIDISRLILFTMVLSAPLLQPTLRVRALDRNRYHFWFLWRGFGVSMKQKSRYKFLPWPEFEPTCRTWQSISRVRYH